MGIYKNAVREQEIMKYSIENQLTVAMQLVTENAVMFTVHEKDLETIQKFCKEKYGSCNVVEDLGDFVMCKVKT